MNSNNPVGLVFLLEEKSAERLIRKLEPKIISKLLPQGQTTSIKPFYFDYIPHNGKNALWASIENKIKNGGWGTPNSFFIILHDQDSNNCVELKDDLKELCSGVRTESAICIVCQELEAWYFGDRGAVEKVFPGFSAKCNDNRRVRGRGPDDIVKPSQELARMISTFRKGPASREIPKHMDICNNTSPSFNYMLKAVENMLRRAGVLP